MIVSRYSELNDNLVAFIIRFLTWEVYGQYKGLFMKLILTAEFWSLEYAHDSFALIWTSTTVDRG